MNDTQLESLFTASAILGDRFATSTTTPQCITIHSLNHDDLMKYLQNEWPAFISRFVDGGVAVA